MRLVSESFNGFENATFVELQVSRADILSQLLGKLQTFSSHNLSSGRTTGCFCFQDCIIISQENVQCKNWYKNENDCTAVWRNV